MAFACAAGTAVAAIVARQRLIYKGRVWIFARRNIKPGEELGYDYGEAYVEAYLSGKCLCAGCAPPVKKAA